jgi:hypothetical protein
MMKLCALNCTILEPLYTRFDKTCESYDCIRCCKSFVFEKKQLKMENNNRIFDEITAWNDKVNNLKGVFGNHVADYRYLIRAKLEHFKEIKATYKTLANQDEKLALKILQAEIRRLERIAFPNRIERFFRKAIENIRAIVEKVYPKVRPETQVEMENEIIKPKNSVELNSHDKSLNKTAIEYHKKLKAVKDDTLLPKLRHSKGNGMKM